MITIRKDNIPNYLHNSKLKKSLNKEEIDESGESGGKSGDLFLTINSKFLKENEEINNTKDWIHLFETYNYWGVNYIPVKLITYYIKKYKKINPIINNLKISLDYTIYSEVLQYTLDVVTRNIKQLWSDKQFFYFKKLGQKVNHRPFVILGRNSTITCETIFKNLDLPWNFGHINKNPNLRPEDVNGKEQYFKKELLDRHPNWIPNYSKLNYLKETQILFYNPNVKFQDILDHSDINWDYDSLSSNKWNNWDYILDNYDYPWNYMFLSKNTMITWNIVKKHLDKKWSFDYLSGNPNFTIEIILENPNYPWNYNYFSSIVTWETVIANPIIPWNYNELSKIIPWHIIYDNPDLPWNSNFVSMNCNVTMKIIEDNLHYPWKYTYVSQNPNISFEFIYNYKDEPWDWKYIGQNNMELSWKSFLYKNLIKYGFRSEHFNKHFNN